MGVRLACKDVVDSSEISGWLFLGDIQIEQTIEVDASQNGWLLKQRKNRYHEVKEIGQRSLDAQPDTSQFNADLRKKMLREKDIFPESPWSSRDLPISKDSLSGDSLQGNICLPVRQPQEIK